MGGCLTPTKDPGGRQGWGGGFQTMCLEGRNEAAARREKQGLGNRWDMLSWEAACTLQTLSWPTVLPKHTPRTHELI